MRYWETRAQIVFAFLLWSKCLPVAFACDSCNHDIDDDDNDDNRFSRQAMTGVIVGCVIAVILLVLFVLWLRRRRLQARRAHSDSDDLSRDAIKRWSPSAPKRLSFPFRFGYHKVSPPTSSTEHVPQYRPREYDLFHGNSQFQPPSSADVRATQEQVEPVPAVTPRTPSGSAAPPLQSPLNQDESGAAAARSPVLPSPAPPRSPQRNTVELPFPPLPPPAPVPTFPVVMAPPGSTVSTSSCAALSIPQTPTYTGPSKRTISGAPPPYTLV